MRKALLLTLLLLLSGACVRAEDKGFAISVDPGTYPVDAFTGIKGATVKAMKREKSPAALPDKETREQAFASVKGLEEKIQPMDNLARDILYVDARTKSLSELEKKYPSIPKALLAKLRVRVRKR
jgi:hypothetical protein